jgi:alkanesulfonate monooxygenase SsuD/methylene tetrahydromethanopterin reductase-like flavin-dependent oxidoreductase (luciferase family)
MFEAAGFPLNADGTMPDALIDELFVYGDAARIATRLRAIQSAGVDELMITIHPAADPAAEETAVLKLLGALSKE